MKLLINHKTGEEWSIVRMPTKARPFYTVRCKDGSLENLQKSKVEDKFYGFEIKAHNPKGFSGRAWSYS